MASFAKIGKAPIAVYYIEMLDLNNQSQNQLNVMMKSTGNDKAKILLIIVLVIIVLCIGSYGYRRKI